jgi:hypothetical protein
MGSDLSRETMLENVQLSVDGGRALTDDAVRAPPSLSRLELSSPSLGTSVILRCVWRSAS